MGCNCKTRYSGGRMPKIKPKDTSKVSTKNNIEKENKNVQK